MPVNGNVMSNMLTKSLLVICCVSLILGCASYGGHKTKKVSDANEMERILNLEIPTGSNILKAESIMRSEGFSVKYQINGSFSNNGRVYDNLTYLYCDRTDGGPIVVQRWQIAVVHSNGKVKNILVSTGFVGP